MKNVTLILVVMALSITMSSCGNNTDNQPNTKEKTQKVKVEKNKTLSGTYVCTEHWNDALVGQIKMTFKNDSVNFSGIANTTYRIKDDSLFIDLHKYEMGFVINGNVLTTTGPAGKVSYTKK